MGTRNNHWYNVAPTLRIMGSHFTGGNWRSSSELCYTKQVQVVPLFWRVQCFLGNLDFPEIRSISLISIPWLPLGGPKLMWGRYDLTRVLRTTSNECVARKLPSLKLTVRHLPGSPPKRKPVLESSNIRCKLFVSGRAFLWYMPLIKDVVITPH